MIGRLHLFALFFLVVFLTFLLSVFWEFGLGEWMLVDLFGMHEEEGEEDIAEKIEYVITVVSFVSIALVPSFLIALFLHKRAERMEQLEHENNQLLAMSEAKSLWVSRVSHEFRTPLNAILGFSDLLRMDLEKAADKEQLVYVDHVLKAGDHLLELVNELLDLNRVESGKINFNLIAVNLNEIIRDCQNMLFPLAEESHIRMLNYIDGEYTVIADKFYLKQILINLLSNAIKYNQTNGSVTLTAGLDKNRVLLNIEDTGQGIAPEKLDGIFELFGCEANLRDSKSKGIGLSISRSLAQQMDSDISVQSEEGRGSRFTLTIPLASSE